MKLKSFRYIFPQAFKSLKLNGWMSFAAIMTVAISLFLCTFFWLLVINIDANAQRFESEVRILAFIHENVSADDYAALEERIRGISGVLDVEYVDREEGLDILSARFDIDLRATLDYDNPLPDRFSIEAEHADAVALIAAQVELIPQIEYVTYGQETVERLFQMTSTMRMIGLVIMGLLGIAAVVLVAMTIRLTVMARQKELKVMKWVGATNAFIRWPFFIEGLILGLLGSTLAVSLVLASYMRAAEWLSETISFLTILSFQDIWFITVIFSILAGIVMGIFGSLISLSRFLKV